jgi:hypothetical protein
MTAGTLLLVVVSQIIPGFPAARDRAPAPVPMAVGTMALSGRIVTDDAAATPVRHASVTLAAGDLQLPRMTVTDDNGHFEFGALAAGNYTLIASRPGYVQVSYGAKRPGRGPGVPIAIVEGSTPPEIVMRLPHGSVITGVVRSSSGAPLPGAGVLVAGIQAGTTGPRNLLPTLQPLTTDDRGVYRAFGLPPGDYVVQVQPTMGGDFGFGGGPDLRQVTSAEIVWADRMTTAPTTAGGPPPALDASPDPARPTTYAPVYFPGTTVPDEASVITLGLGEEKTGVDLTMQLVPTARLTGSVIDPEGRPQDGMSVSLRSAQGAATDIVSRLMGGGGGITQGGGNFMLNSVKPGRYTLQVRGTPRSSEPGAKPSEMEQVRTMMMAMLPGMGGATGASHWAAQDIVVDGRDQSDIVLRLQPGMTMTGKIAFDATSLTPPGDLSVVRLTMGDAGTGASVIDMALSFMTSTMIPTTAEGTFEAKGLAPGKYRLNVVAPGLRQNATAPGTGWMLKSITLNGRDIADLPLEIKPSENITGLVVTLTDRPTEISGTILDQAGRATSTFPIVVFSTDRTYWVAGSRRVQQGRPSSDGKYLIAGLPAGEYYVCAVTDLESTSLADPSFLEQLISGSFKITLGEGEKKTQDLKLAGG